MPLLLNWSIITLSLVNTILLFWLGLTVGLNAERRTWGVWLISGGLLLGAVFFVSHTAILGYGMTSLDHTINFWWYLGLLAALILPCLWYVAILWYAGFWENNYSNLHRRHRIAFALSGAVSGVSLVLLLFANPFPSFSQVISLQLSQVFSMGGVPVMVIAYLLSTLLNVGLSLDVLNRPGPVRRIMGDLARDRAKPWLVITSFILLFVGLLIAAVMVWLVFRGNGYVRSGLYDRMETGIAWFDMAISGLITLAVLSLGQAVVGYEVFTGKALPQQRFKRHWRNVVLLAMSFGMVMSAVLIENVEPIYLLLVMGVLVTISYALFSQNSYAERERYIQHLRPFVVSQRLYDHLLAPADPAGIDLYVPFQALCRDVLGAHVAYLVAVGPLAPLGGSLLVYPQNSLISSLPLASLCRQFSSPQTLCVPVAPAVYGDTHWAIPLWSERGLIGVLLLGEKANGSLYTQEEIEIARASGERLIDTKASVELAQRLMALQRQRLVESQVADRRTRRLLHDDILPRLHTAMLTLNVDKSSTTQEAVKTLADIHRDIAYILRTMPNGLATGVGSGSLIDALQNLIKNDLDDEFDEVAWNLDSQAKLEAQKLPVLTTEVVYFAAREVMRNAARHARGSQDDRYLKLTITVSAATDFRLVIEDNGVGLSDTLTSSAGGTGLTLHSTLMAIAGGLLIVEGSPETGTRVTLAVNKSEGPLSEVRKAE